MEFIDGEQIKCIDSNIVEANFTIGNTYTIEEPLIIIAPDVLKRYPDMRANFCLVEDDTGNKVLFHRFSLEQHFESV